MATTRAKRATARILPGGLDRTDLGEKVSRAIRATTQAGDRLREVQLSREFNVRRTALREALRFWEQEGLVKREPYHGAYVSSAMSKDELRQVFRIGAVLESMAIEDARLHPRHMVRHFKDRVRYYETWKEWKIRTLTPCFGTTEIIPRRECGLTALPWCNRIARR